VSSCFQALSADPYRRSPLVSELPPFQDAVFKRFQTLPAVCVSAVNNMPQRFCFRALCVEVALNGAVEIALPLRFRLPMYQRIVN